MKNPKAILEEIKSMTTEILGDNLVGIYIHGSLAFDCFNWHKSDIDYLVVISSPLTLLEKTEYISKILKINENAPPKGIEMSIILEEHCKNFVYPTPYDLHFSNGHLERAKSDINLYCKTMHGTDPDLAAHFTVIRAVGFTLYGKEINEVFAPVPARDYLDSIRLDVGNAVEDIFENPVYVILNLCRVLAYIRYNSILSKDQGGEWGIDNLPESYHEIIENALSCYRSDSEYPVAEYATYLLAFAGYMLKRILSDKINC